MGGAVKILVLVYTCFIAFLSLSGFAAGIVGDIVYYSAFVFPFIIGFYGARRLKAEREAIAGVCEENLRPFRLSAKNAVGILPIIFPTVAIIFFASFATSWLMGYVGVQGAAVQNTGLINMILVHALIPSVLEEMLFRFIPMILLLPYSPRYCALISAICFSLCHCDIFKIPYAFIAGLIFIAVDVATGSVLPSMIMHFINNTASVIWIIIDSGTYVPLYLAVLIGLAVLSVIPIIVWRKDYKEALCCVTTGTERFKGGRELLVLVVLTLVISLTNLFVG